MDAHRKAEVGNAVQHTLVQVNQEPALLIRFAGSQSLDERLLISHRGVSRVLDEPVDQSDAALHRGHESERQQDFRPVIGVLGEIRQEADAPRDLAARLSAVLTEATGTRWTIALSASTGEASLAEQGDAADHARRLKAETHPLVQAILLAFPGAKIEAVRDSNVDTYGLPATPTLGGEGEPENFELPPPGSDDFDEPSDFWETTP